MTTELTPLPTENRPDNWYDVWSKECFWELFFHRKDIVAENIYVKKYGRNNWYFRKNWNTLKPIPPTREDVYKHYTGDYHIGAYPHKEDNTCMWIAADFDDSKNAYKDAVATYETALAKGIQAWLEVSKGGKGYHVWVFFKNPTDVPSARRMMKNLLTLAGVIMTGPYQKGSDNERSFDKFFPANDSLGGDGRGNLVGLPYQGKHAKENRTVFIDSDGQPLGDMLLVLWNAHIKRVDFDGEAAQHLHSLEFEDVDYSISKPREANPMDAEYWRIMGELPGQVDRIRGCEAIKAMLEDTNQFSEPAWHNIMSNLAPFGKDGLQLAHEVTQGYSLGKGYDEKETETKFYHKVDHMQRGGNPMGCKALMYHWTCPAYKKCQYHMIATYGAPASLTVTNKIGLDSTKEMMELESQDIYKAYRNLFPRGTKAGYRVEKSYKTGLPGMEERELTDKDIVLHVTGKEVMMVSTTGPEGSTVRSVYQWIESEDDRDKFVTFLNSKNAFYCQNGGHFWILGTEDMGTTAVIADMARWLYESGVAGGGIETKIISKGNLQEEVTVFVNSAVSINPFNAMNHRFAPAPYFGEIGSVGEVIGV